MLQNYQKRRVEQEIVNVMRAHPNGCDTREIITEVLQNLQKIYPAVNRHHIAGMLAWVIKKYGYSLPVRYPGFMI